MKAEIISIYSDNATGKFRITGLELNILFESLADQILLQFIEDNAPKVKVLISGKEWSVSKRSK